MFDRSIPMIRVAFLLRYARFIEHLGAPVERLFSEAGIPEELLGHPAAGVCLRSAFKFGELATKATGTEHLGLYVGMRTSLDDLGPVGEQLKRSTTVYDYLRKGIQFYNMLITGQRIWLSNHGESIRLNVATIDEPCIGSYQSQLETLSVTLMALRCAVGQYWSPREIGLTYQSREEFPQHSCFGRSNINYATDVSYMVIPRTALGTTFPEICLKAEQAQDPIDIHGFSDDLTDLVKLQIEALLSEERLHIDTVAESMMMSRRSLQRVLAEHGTSYSSLLSDIRIRLAMNKLQTSDEPIGDIAFDLGYSDTSNFTRAFRCRNGISPQAFRRDANSDLRTALI